MQNRKPPAYQEYAAELLSNRQFRLMTLAQRGLLQTMRLECWVNTQIPAQPTELARYLGLADEDVRSALSDSVKSFFSENDGSFSCLELENYRAHLADRKDKQSQGGKRGSAITNGKRNRPAKATDDGVSSTPPSTQQPPRQGRGESLVQSSTEKPSQTQSSEKGITPTVNSVGNEEWLDEYATAECCTPEAYPVWSFDSAQCEQMECSII